MPDSSSSDGDLVRLAQLGDTNALGTLLARHMAGMKAVALSTVGFGPDAEDAVQEASLRVLERIGDLRDPEAVGAWLHAVVRNVCRMQLRRAARLVPKETVDDLPSGDPSPDSFLERHALRDWMWHSIGELPEPLQLTAMLRYFSGLPSYENVAAASGVPVSTVRSRLHKARAKLSDALLATADRSHGDADAFTAERHREEQELFEAAQKGELRKFAAETWSPDVEVYVRESRRPEIGELLMALESDLEAGMQPRVVRTIASSDITIWENEMIFHEDTAEARRISKAWLLLHERKSGRLRLYPPAVPFKGCRFAEELS